MVDKYGKTSHRNHQELHPERVVVMVVRCAELGIHQIYGSVQPDDEEDFHHRVVDWHKRGEQVEIASCENHREHDLRLAGYSCHQQHNTTNGSYGSCSRLTQSRQEVRYSFTITNLFHWPIAFQCLSRSIWIFQLQFDLVRFSILSTGTRFRYSHITVMQVGMYRL